MGAPTVTVRARRPAPSARTAPHAGVPPIHPDGSRPWLSSRRLLAVAALGLLVAGFAANNPAVVLLGLVAVTTGVLRRWAAPDLALFAAPLVLVLLAVTAGMAADAAGVDLLAAPASLALLYLGVACLGVADAWRSRGRQAPAPPSRLGLLAGIPATIALATGVLQSVSTGVAKSWAFGGSDLLHHLMMVGAVQRAGHLDYDYSSYPRGIHMLATLSSVPSPPLADPVQLLGYDLRLTAALSWFSLAALLAAATVLIRRVGGLLGLPGRLSALAALVFGAGALLTNTFLTSFVMMGAAPSLLAVAAMWAAPVAAAAAQVPGRRIPVVVAVSSLAGLMIGHLWQALLVVPVLALLTCAAGWLGRLSRVPRRAWPVLSGVALGSVALGVVPLRAVQDAGGAGLAAQPGLLPGEPWLLLVPALLTVGILVNRVRDDWARLMLGSLAGMIVSLAVLVAGSGDLDLEQWYPLKTLWFVALFLAPLLALAAVVLARALTVPAWRLLGRAGRAAFVLRTTCAALAAAVALALWLPWMLGSGSQVAAAWEWTGDEVPAEDARFETSQNYDLAVRHGTAYLPARMVPYEVGSSARLDGLSTRQVSEMLNFLTGQPTQPDPRVTVCEQIRLAAAGRAAVVVSKLSPRRVAREMVLDGCPGRARVVHVPGRLLDVAPLSADAAQPSDVS